jgi:hypothetical protein
MMGEILSVTDGAARRRSTKQILLTIVLAIGMLVVTNEMAGDRDKTGTSGGYSKNGSSQVTMCAGLASLGSFQAERGGLSYQAVSSTPVGRRVILF